MRIYKFDFERLKFQSIRKITIDWKIKTWFQLHKLQIIDWESINLILKDWSFNRLRRFQSIEELKSSSSQLFPNNRLRICQFDCNRIRFQSIRRISINCWIKMRFQWVKSSIIDWIDCFFNRLSDFNRILLPKEVVCFEKSDFLSDNQK